MDVFHRIDLIPTLSTLSDFIMPPIAMLELPDDHGSADFSQHNTFQHFLQSIYRYRVWIRDASGIIIEFSPEIKVMFMKVASIVAGIHLNGECAGDLINRIRIYGDLSVNFPFPNKPIDENATLSSGILTDLLHFRRMVAEIIISTVPNFDADIPFHLKLFFSEIFLQHPEKYAYLQLMHPVFYDASQRCAFFQLNKEYVEENRVAEDALRLLRDGQYPFRRWSRRFPGNQGSAEKAVFASAYSYNNSAYKNGAASTLPIYMRNFQYHCRTKNMLSPTHEEMDALLHQTYPGVAEAVVDSHIRSNHIIWFESQLLPPDYELCHRTFMDYLISKPFPFVILPYEYKYW